MLNYLSLSIVVLPRFELGMTEPKSVVLPLHHRTVPFSVCKDSKILFISKFFEINFEILFIFALLFFSV